MRFHLIFINETAEQLPNYLQQCFTKPITIMKTYHLALLLLFQFPVDSSSHQEALKFSASSTITDSQPKRNINKGLANIVFRSADGGQTWEDISHGLPEHLQEQGVHRDAFFSDESGLYLSAGNGIYHSKPNARAPFWENDIFTYEHSCIAPGKNGIYAYNYDGQLLQKINGRSIWPLYTNVQEKEMRTVFETAGGTVFMGSEEGLFKSLDNGKNWKQVQAGGWVMKLAESDGVLLAPSQGGIIRSTDDGETWDLVISEGGVGIAVESIAGGFAAISYNTSTKSRRIHISLDSGKTWKAIDKGLKPSLYISSIKQVGKYFICGHSDGIFRSSDMGKTWKLLLPSIKDKVFNLSVSGNVIYAIPGNRGRGC
jgi:photosystem II stability/assembly factor-like uncharacterized protein